MAGPAPAATCTLSPEGTITTVRIGTRCKVTYEFDTSATSAGLALPYVVAIDGKVPPEYETKPRALGPSRRKIELLVKPGSRIALFLNSDVHPDHRRHPVYPLKVGENDVYVKITEGKGRIGHEHPRLQGPYCGKGASGGTLDMYHATLTGNIWMTISHVYTAAEADALLPSDTSPTVRAAVRRIYAGLPRPELIVDFPASDSAPKLRLKVEFREEMTNNVRANTTWCDWLTGILPRTHPRAYAALLTEAHAARVTLVRVTSAWRPCFGSIAHRAGLGLDITYIEGGEKRAFFNRAFLVNLLAPKNGNVSERERALWREYQDAKAEVAAREKELKLAQRDLDRKRDPGKVTHLKDAERRRVESVDREATARKAWDDERNRNEPGIIRNLRERLGKNKSIKQLFDPWYMDSNTTDDIPPVPNEQRHSNSNERVHNNHLHITVLEPKIL